MTSMDKLLMFVEGLLLPSGEGATWRFLDTLNALVGLGVETKVVHPFRGWSDIKLISEQKFETFFVNPRDYYSSPELLRLVIEKSGADAVISKEPEVISHLYTNSIIQPHISVIYDCHDVFSRFDKSKECTERAIFESVDWSFFISCEECRYVNENYGVLNTTYIPCTIDASRGRRFHREVGKKIGFLGHFYYEPNEEAVRTVFAEFMPRIWKLDASIELHLFGDCPASLRTELVDPRVVWHGLVDDTAEALAECDVALSYVLRGTGFRVKTLHYMAAGLPIVGNDIGVTGVGRREFFVLSDDLHRLAGETYELLRSPGRRNLMAKQAQSVLEQEFSSQAASCAYTEMLSSLHTVALKKKPPLTT